MAGMMAKKKEGRKFCVTAYPYAVQWGTIIVPEEYQTKLEVENYIDEHFDDIEFGQPDLDYAGTDWECNEEE